MGGLPPTGEGIRPVLQVTIQWFAVRFQFC